MGEKKKSVKEKKKESPLEKLYSVLRDGDPTDDDVEHFVNLLTKKFFSVLTQWKCKTTKQLKKLGFERWTGKAANDAVAEAIDNVKHGKTWQTDFINDLEEEAIRFTKEAKAVEEEYKAAEYEARHGVMIPEEKIAFAKAKRKEYIAAAKKVNLLGDWYFYLIDIPKTLSFTVNGMERPGRSKIRRILLQGPLEQYIAFVAVNYPSQYETLLTVVAALERGEIKESRARAKYPEYFVRTTDLATKTVLDYQGKYHDKLYTGQKGFNTETKRHETKYSVNFPDKQKTKLEIWDWIGDGLKEIPPRAKPVFDILTTLIVNEIDDGHKPPYEWPLNHVIRCYKTGGVFPENKVYIDETDVSRIEHRLGQLGSLGIRIEWTEKVGDTTIPHRYSGQLIQWSIKDGVLKISEIPPLIEHALEIGQISRIESACVTVFYAGNGDTIETIEVNRRSINRTEKVLALENCLRCRINDMQRQGEQKKKETDEHYLSRRTIKMQYLWDHCRDTSKPMAEWREWESASRTEKKRFRELVISILDSYKESGFIKKYELVKDRYGSVHRVVITT